MNTHTQVNVQARHVKPSESQQVIAREAIAMILIGLRSLERIGFDRDQVLRSLREEAGK